MAKIYPIPQDRRGVPDYKRKPRDPRIPGPIHDRHVKDFAAKFLLTEIKYDVKFDSWLKQRTLNAEAKNTTKKEEVESVHYAYDNDNAEDWLVRQIDSAVNTIYGELPWCTEDYSRMDSDEILDNPTEWAIHFHFSEHWRGSMRAIKTYAHKYIVNYVLSQWYRAENLQATAVYTADAEKALEDLLYEARNERVILPPFTL